MNKYNQLIYVKPSNKYDFNCVNEELYYIKTKHLKMICTKNHKVYIKYIQSNNKFNKSQFINKNINQFEFVEAEKIIGKMVKYKKNVINNLPNLEYFVLNDKNNTNITEGFTDDNTSTTKNDDVFKVIENKLKGLVQELGGNDGKTETKKILVSTKKICDLECAKCMMTLISDKKSLKTIDLENILDDETDETCIKCKKYTELSSQIKSIIDNL